MANYTSNVIELKIHDGKLRHTIMQLHLEKVIGETPDSKILNDKHSSGVGKHVPQLLRYVVSTGSDKQPAEVWPSETAQCGGWSLNGDLHIHNYSDKNTEMYMNVCGYNYIIALVPGFLSLP